MTVLCFRSTNIRVAFWATFYKWLDVDSLVMIAICVCNCDMQILCNKLMLLMFKHAKVIGKIKKTKLLNMCLCFFLQDILSLLRSMYALIFFEEDAAFLRYGYLSTDNADAVRKEVTKLCSELRPHALALVNSFGIPDAFLGPIAFNWIDANAWSSVQQ